MIRPACPGDAAAVAAIWNPVIRDTAITFNSIEKSPADVAELIAARQAAGHGFFVAEANGRNILGFASYGQFRAGIGYARTMEHTVIVPPAARRAGTGMRLMEALEEHAEDAGARTMFAGVSSGNPEGRHFHARLGYVEVAILREVGFKFGRWFDLHLMQKRLAVRDSVSGSG